MICVTRHIDCSPSSSPLFPSSPSSSSLFSSSVTHSSSSSSSPPPPAAAAIAAGDAPANSFHEGSLYSLCRNARTNIILNASSCISPDTMSAVASASASPDARMAVLALLARLRRSCTGGLFRVIMTGFRWIRQNKDGLRLVCNDHDHVRWCDQVATWVR